MGAREHRVIHMARDSLFRLLTHSLAGSWLTIRQWEELCDLAKRKAAERIRKPKPQDKHALPGSAKKEAQVTSQQSCPPDVSVKLRKP